LTIKHKVFFPGDISIAEKRAGYRYRKYSRKPFRRCFNEGERGWPDPKGLLIE
jgi:hypothetical protein